MTVEPQVFVRLIRQHNQIVLDSDVSNPPEFSFGKHHTSRVVR